MNFEVVKALNNIIRGRFFWILNIHCERFRCKEIKINNLISLLNAVENYTKIKFKFSTNNKLSISQIIQPKLILKFNKNEIH